VWDQRVEFVVRASRGERLSSLCREYEISRPTGYLWLQRFRQILTVQQLLDGKQPEYPASRDATFKKAPRSRPEAERNLTLPLLPLD
jgi:Helix-turn-helix domain